jgi:hypothetical protein
VAKAKPKLDEVRERRIRNDIVVDAHDPEERAIGWYCYLQDTMQFPFTATCIARRQISPLRLKDEVEILELADEAECQHEVYVLMRREKEGLGVPLSQIKPIEATDKETKQAVQDWHYWTAMGYEF